MQKVESIQIVEHYLRTKSLFKAILIPSMKQSVQKWFKTMFEETDWHITFTTLSKLTCLQNVKN